MKLSLTYRDHIFNIHRHNEVIDEQGIHSLYQQFKQLAGNIPNIFPIFYILDYTTLQYICLTDSVYFTTAYPPEEFMQGEGGAGKMIEIMQKDDYAIFNKKVFSANAAFLKKTPHTEHGKYVFSFSYRVQRKDGLTANLWQSGTYITSAKTGMPLYNIGVALDVSAVKKDTIITHTIEKVDEKNNLKKKTLIESNFFYPYEEDTLFTRQERNILAHIADGLSSKQIAAKLKISTNTIANHRQNMLQKSNTKNVAELIAIAIRSRII